MNQWKKELMTEAGFVAPELACRASKLADIIVQDILKVVAAHSLTNDTALDVFSNLKRIYTVDD